MKYFCRVCKVITTCALISLPCCGFQVCFDHLNEIPSDIFDCMICKTKNMSKGSVYTMFINKNIILEIELNEKLEELKSLLKYMSNLKNEVKPILDANFNKIARNILYRRNLLINEFKTQINFFTNEMFNKLNENKAIFEIKINKCLSDVNVSKYEVFINQISKQRLKNDNDSLESKLKLLEEKLIELTIKKLNVEFLEKETNKTRFQETLQLPNYNFENFFGQLDLLIFKNDRKLAPENKNFKKCDRKNFDNLKVISFDQFRTGELILSTADFKLLIMNLDGSIIKKTEGFKHLISDIQFFRDDSIIGLNGTKIEVWDRHKDINLNISFQQIESENIKCYEIWNNYQVLSGHGNGLIYLWDIQTRVKLKAFVGNSSQVMFFKKINNHYFLCVTNDFKIKLWNISKHNCIKVFNEHTNSIYTIENLNEFEFISSSEDKTIKIWNLSGGPTITFKTDLEVIKTIVVFQSNKFITGSDNGHVKLWDKNFGVLEQILPKQSNGIMAIKILQNDEIVCCLDDNSLVFWN